VQVKESFGQGRKAMKANGAFFTQLVGAAAGAGMRKSQVQQRFFYGGK
jgi:hypothetical protein